MTLLDDIRSCRLPLLLRCGDAAAAPSGRGTLGPGSPSGGRRRSAVGLWAEEAFAAGDDVGQEVGCGPGCAPGSDHDHYVGGQAILEGVMMRGRHSWGLAVRQPSGSIARHSFDLPLLGERHPLFKLPVVRGIGALWESLSLGIKALSLSANLSLSDGPAASSAEGDPAPTRRRRGRPGPDFPAHGPGPMGDAGSEGPAAVDERGGGGRAPVTPRR